MSEGAQSRPRFSTAAYAYTAVFFFVLSFMPLFVTSTIGDRLPLPRAYWIAACIWPGSMAVLALYARHRCSSDRMTFRDGLFWVTSSMMTGWMYQSFFTVFAGLAAAYCAGVFVAFAGDLHRDPSYSPERWLQVVRFFYSHRMRR